MNFGSGKLELYPSKAGQGESGELVRPLSQPLEKQNTQRLLRKQEDLPLNNSINIQSPDFKLYLAIALGSLSSKVVAL